MNPLSKCNTPLAHQKCYTKLISIPGIQGQYEIVVPRKSEMVKYFTDGHEFKVLLVAQKTEEEFEQKRLLQFRVIKIEEEFSYHPQDGHRIVASGLGEKTYCSLIYIP